MDKGVQSFYKKNICFKTICMCLRFIIYPKKCFQSSISHMRACFFSFMIEGSEKSHLWRSYISTINLYPSWLMNLAKGKEIMNFHMLLSAKSVLEDFTLKAMRNFGAAVNTCALTYHPINAHIHFKTSWNQLHLQDHISHVL